MHFFKLYKCNILIKYYDQEFLIYNELDLKNVFIPIPYQSHTNPILIPYQSHTNPIPIPYQSHTNSIPISYKLKFI